MMYRESRTDPRERSLPETQELFQSLCCDMCFAVLADSFSFRGPTNKGERSGGKREVGGNRCKPINNG